TRTSDETNRRRRSTRTLGGEVGRNPRLNRSGHSSDGGSTRTRRGDPVVLGSRSLHVPFHLKAVLHELEGHLVGTAGGVNYRRSPRHLEGVLGNLAEVEDPGGRGNGRVRRVVTFNRLVGLGSRRNGVDLPLMFNCFCRLPCSGVDERRFGRTDPIDHVREVFPDAHLGKGSKCCGWQSHSSPFYFCCWWRD